MESAWQTIQDFAYRAYAGAQAAVGAAEPWQILLVVTALVVIAVLLAIGLRVAARSGDAVGEALEESARQLSEVQAQAAQAEEKAAQAEAMVSKAEVDRQTALKALEEAKDRQITESANQLALAKSRIDQLERMQIDETAFLTGARMEAARIVRDAKDYAFTVASRADVEYAEMMRHANEEAENLRALSQQRLDQAHETLKKALNRATEIIAEAHAGAARGNRAYYEAPPTRLIDADAETAPEPPAAGAGSDT
jgi:chromosome segregation ATPase